MIKIGSRFAFLGILVFVLAGCSQLNNGLIKQNNADSENKLTSLGGTVPSTDLSVKMAGSIPSNILANDQLSVSFNIKNNGPDTVPSRTELRWVNFYFKYNPHYFHLLSTTIPSSWVCRDSIPMGDMFCTPNPGTILPIGDLGQFTFNFQVDPNTPNRTISQVSAYFGPRGNGNLYCKAYSSGASDVCANDHNLGNNSVENRITIINSSDLSLTSQVFPNDPKAGDTVLHYVNIKNTGPTDASHVSFDYKIDPNLTFLDLFGVTNDWNCIAPTVGARGGTIHCELTEPLLAGRTSATNSILFVTQVRETVAIGTEIRNEASIAASVTSEINALNNKVFDSMIVN